MSNDIVKKRRESRERNLLWPVGRKLAALVKNINNYIAVYAQKSKQDVDTVLDHLGFDRSSWCERNVVPDTITLKELMRIERLGMGPVIDVTERWRKTSFQRSGMAFGRGTIGDGITLDPDISDEMFQDLIAANAFWRVSEMKVGGAVDYVVTFAIPRAIADKHGFPYSLEWFKGDDRWCLTDDDYVVPVHHRVARGAGFFRATSVFGVGTRHRGRAWFVTDCSPKNLILRAPDWFQKLRYEEMYGLEDVLKVREDAFAAAYVATGSKDVAIGTSTGISRSKHTTIARELLKNPRVVQMVEERTRNAMQSVFQRLGIEGNPEEFVVGTVIEMTKIIMDAAKKEDAQLNPKLLAIVQENADKLADFLAMKSENRMVTTERTLELSEGDRTMIAREIEKRKGEAGLLPESAEVVVEEAVSE